MCCVISYEIASFHIILLATYKAKKESTTILSEKNEAGRSYLNRRFKLFMLK